MKTHTDQDGKSTSAGDFATHEQIAQRAHQLWVERGRPPGSAELDWFEAEEQLRAQTNSATARNSSNSSGSVQR